VRPHGDEAAKEAEDRDLIWLWEEHPDYAGWVDGGGG
jgi:hypothetical protein